MMDEYKEDKSWLSRLRKPADPNRFNNDTRLEALEERVEALEQKGGEADNGEATSDASSPDVAEPRSVEECNCFDVLGHRLTEGIGYAYFSPCPMHDTPGHSDSQPDVEPQSGVNHIHCPRCEWPIEIEDGLESWHQAPFVRRGTPGPSDTQDGLDRTLTKNEALVRDSDLVERVADAIVRNRNIDDTPEDDARAAIREVADWLEDEGRRYGTKPVSAYWASVNLLRSQLED